MTTDYSLKYNVGYEANQWLANILLKYNIDYTIIKGFIFVDKSNKDFMKVIRKRKFSHVKPVIMVNRDFNLIEEYITKEVNVLEDKKVLLIEEHPIFNRAIGIRILLSNKR